MLHQAPKYRTVAGASKRRRTGRADPRLVSFAKTTAEVALVGLLPVAIYFVYQVQPFSLATAIDSFIYAGYSQHLSDLIARSGFPYFAVRFGLILPARAASYMFGPVAGYFVMRYGLAALASGFLYLLARRRGARAAGWLGCVILLSSPIFLRALMTFYADTIGLPMFVVALCCLLMPSRRPGCWYLLAGLALGLAINANLYLAGLSAVVIATTGILHGLRREVKRVVALILVLAGVVVVTGLGALYYREAFGLTNVLYPSWHFFVSEGSIAAKNARAPNYGWLNFELYVYIPLIILLAGILLLLQQLPRRSGASNGDGRPSRIQSLLRSPLLDSVAFLAAAEAFYALVEFALRGYQLETFFYASYLWAFAAVTFTIIAAEILSKGVLTPAGGAAVAGALALLPLATHSFFPHLVMWAFPTVPIMAAIIGVLVVAGATRPSLHQAALTTLVGCIALLGVTAPRHVPFSRGQTIRADPHYEAAINNSDRTGLDVYKVSLQLMDALPRWDRDPGTIVFWYPSDESVVNLIQATYLWLPDTIQYGDPGLPTLTAAEVAHLKGRAPRRLVLLGMKADEVATGHSELIAAGVHPQAVTNRILHAGTVTVYMESMIFQAAPCDQQWRSLKFAWADMPPTCG